VINDTESARFVRLFSRIGRVFARFPVHFCVWVAKNPGIPALKAEFPHVIAIRFTSFFVRRPGTRWYFSGRRM